MNLDEFMHEFRALSDEWVNLDSHANLMEKMEKTVFGEIVSRGVGDNGWSIARAEHEARAAEPYKKHVTEMIEARTAANRAKARLESMRITFEAWRTQQATRRAEIGLH